ncbi:MAG: hypothetical protein L0H59_08890 [Tomitella sp.]|nr:hypothetical protein [Tomitella sp.]
MDTATSRTHRNSHGTTPPEVCDDGFLPPHTTVGNVLVTTGQGRVQVYEDGALIVEVPADLASAIGAVAQHAAAGGGSARAGRRGDAR